MKLQKNTISLTFALSVILLLSGALTGCKIKNTDKRTTPNLITFTECSQLEKRLKDNLKKEMQESLLYYNDMYIYSPISGGGFPVPGDKATDSAFADAGNHQEGVDYSGTNNQEAGIDEADFVKTDGSSLFIVNNKKLFILPVAQFGLLDNGTSVGIEGTPYEILIYKKDPAGKAEKAVIFSTLYAGELTADHPLYSYLSTGTGGSFGYYYPTYRTSTLTKLTLIDLKSTPAYPVVNELYYEGTYQTARLIKNSVHMVLYSWPELSGLKYWPELPAAYYATVSEAARKAMWNTAVQKTNAENELFIDSLTLKDLVPCYYVLTGGQVQPHNTAADLCSNFSIADDGVSRGFTSIFSFDLSENDLVINGDYIVTNWSTVYASSSALVIAEPSNGQWWYRANATCEEATNIHKFTLAAGKSNYSGSGRISGSIIDQFSLSEYDGALRIAATTNAWSRWWDAVPAQPENHIYVLRDADNGSLRTVGHVGGIATGERIWASRFIGSKGYLVTFRNIDPLWTIDLSDAANPKIIGTIDVPGVATYLQPISEDRLLTIGYGGDENGLDGSIQVSLFNVGDFSHPVLIDKMSLALNSSDNSGSAWYTSEALYQHKAFQYWEPLQLLAVPLSGSKSSWDMYGSGNYSYISKLVLLKVNKDTGFSLQGEVDHSPYYNNENTWYWGNQDIRRSIFMGNYIYAISDRAVTAHFLDTMTQTAAVSLPGTAGDPWVYVKAD